MGKFLFLNLYQIFFSSINKLVKVNRISHLNIKCVLKDDLGSKPYKTFKICLYSEMESYLAPLTSRIATQDFQEIMGLLSNGDCQIPLIY